MAGDYQARALESPRAAQRFWHAARIRLIDRLAPPKPGTHVADVGCGSGVIASHLGRSGAHVVGFDSNPAAIGFASKTHGSSQVRFVLGPFEHMRKEAPYDHIYCLEVLEHLYEEQVLETLQLFADSAAPAATLFVTTPNGHSAWPLIEWTLDRLKIVPTLHESQHVSVFTRARLARALNATGWTIEELGTFNGVAPFVAPVSERLARSFEAMEFAARRFLPCNLLYCRARRRRE
jgi:2-polyprenyl-3-methyl-5-hydroxy-6-metoxy-1,4-benzoquinol methylase